MSEGELKKRGQNEYPLCEVCSKVTLPNPAQSCYDARHKYPSDCPKDIWFDEAKKDIENEACFEAYSYSLTESEESIIIPLRIWKKWLGDST